MGTSPQAGKGGAWYAISAAGQETKSKGDNSMKTILMAVVMLGLAGSAYAGSAAGQLGLGDVTVQQLPIPVPSAVFKCQAWYKTNGVNISSAKVISLPATSTGGNSEDISVDPKGKGAVVFSGGIDSAGNWTVFAYFVADRTAIKTAGDAIRLGMENKIPYQLVTFNGKEGFSQFKYGELFSTGGVFISLRCTQE